MTLDIRCGILEVPHIGVAEFKEGRVSDTHTMPTMFVRGDNYLLLPRQPQPWLIKDMLPAGGCAVLYGKPKLGKSFLALDMVSAISDPLREECLGQRVHQHGNVLYIQVDTARGTWANRMEKMQNAGYTFDNVWFTDSLLVNPYPLNIMQPVHQQNLRKAVTEYKAVLVVVDVLREIHQANEDSSGEMQGILAALVEATRPATLLLVAHSRKDNAQRGADLMWDLRGSGYMAGRMDAIMRIEGKGDTPVQLNVKTRASDDLRIPIKRLENGIISKDEDRPTESGEGDRHATAETLVQLALQQEQPPSMLELAKFQHEVDDSRSVERYRQITREAKKKIEAMPADKRPPLNKAVLKKLQATMVDALQDEQDEGA